MSSVAEVFSRPGVVAFGRALRARLRPRRKEGDRWVEEKDLDYATLASLEIAQTPEQLAEVARGFLRRFRAYTNKVRSEVKAGERGRDDPEGAIERWERLEPTQANLLDLIAAPYDFDPEQPNRAVSLVRAALIAHALVRFDHSDPDREEDTHSD